MPSDWICSSCEQAEWQEQARMKNLDLSLHSLNDSRFYQYGIFSSRDVLGAVEYELICCSGLDRKLVFSVTSRINTDRVFLRNILHPTLDVIHEKS